jgi:hypothetical protein
MASVEIGSEAENGRTAIAGFCSAAMPPAVMFGLSLLPVHSAWFSFGR